MLKRPRIVLPALIAFAAAGGVASANQPASTVPLIPRDVLFGNPERAQGRISPDGKQLAFTAPVDGVMNVFVAPADDLSKAKPVTKDTGRGIRQYFWAYTSKHILYIQDKGGDESWKVLVVDLATGAERDLTPFDDIKGPDLKPILLPSGKPLRPTARIEGVSHLSPETIVIGLNNRDPRLHDLHTVNILTGEMKLKLQNPGFVEFTLDDSYSIRYAANMNPDGSTTYLKPAAGEGAKAGEFTEDFTVPFEDSATTGMIGFSKDGNTLYMTDSRGRNTGALVARDLVTGQSKTIVGNDKADAGAVLMHPTENTIQAVVFNYEKPTWTLIDRSLERDWQFLIKELGSTDFSVTSRSLDDRVWTLAVSYDDRPPTTYLYDRGDQNNKPKVTKLWSSLPALENTPLVKMTPTIIKSRDGLDLVSYLCLPPDSDSDGDARPESPVPMVLLVHGGPWARDGWGFNPLAQWLANRGYAVLMVNFRGSTGFGKDFLNAGNKEWAAKMHDDLIDAVDWAVKEKIAIKDKVAIMGGSYGGYATLVGMTFTPEVFAAGISIVGPSNIVTLLNTIPPDWTPMMAMFRARVGDHTSESGKEFLNARSPLTFVDRIKRPLLIGQGANDPRVKQSESDQIVAAMEAKKIPVTYVLYPDEGHGFARPPNRTSFNAVTEAFLAEVLGGRFEPVGDDFTGSSITVPHGAEFIPSIKEALSTVGK
jgi:dipeptidyl aminopeptidase/acylaminoacyl peptidase